jgi:hypothetical protein
MMTNLLRSFELERSLHNAIGLFMLACAIAGIILWIGAWL